MQDVSELFYDKLSAFDCPHCGATSSITPSLAGVFLTEDVLLLLDRGFDCEPGARAVVAPLLNSLGISLKRELASDLAEFKSAFADRMKNSVKRFPFSALNFHDRPGDFANWESLQGEILSAMFLGALGVVPGLSFRASAPNGVPIGKSQTLQLIRELALHLITGWACGLQSLTMSVPLEALLARLLDTCNVMALIADELSERLADIRRSMEADKVEEWIFFHFLAVEATILAVLRRDNPNAGQWALEYLRIRCAAHREGELISTRFLLSPQRTSLTISYPHVWNAVGAAVVALTELSDRTEYLQHVEALEKAVAELGYEGLLATVMVDGLRFQIGDGDLASNRTPKEIADIIIGQRAKLALPWGVLLHLWDSPQSSNPEAVAQLFDLVEPLVKDISERAEIFSWLGKRMKDLGAPAFALARIGREVMPWEELLTDLDKRNLWTERSSALRLTGQHARALEIAQDTMVVTFGDESASMHDKSTALLNVGINLRENGRFEEALEHLEAARQTAPASSRWMPLQSLAVTYLQMGRMAEAADALETARNLAGGHQAGAMRVALLANEISARRVLGQNKRVEELARELPRLDEVSDAALIQFSGLMIVLPSHLKDLDKSREAAIATVGRLTGFADRLAGVENHKQAQLAWNAAASLAQEFDLPDKKDLWLKDAASSELSGRWPDTRTAIELATTDIAVDSTQFPKNITTILEALGQQAGGIAVDAMTMNLLAPLDRPFQRLAKAVFESDLGPPADQLLAEVRRNAHRRARLNKEGDGRAVGHPFTAANAMKAGQPAFIVIEWCDLAGGDMVGVVSHLAPGQARSEYLYYRSDLDVVDTARLIGARLEKWRNSRLGEPFEVAGWEKAVQWLRQVAEDYLPGGGHVVIIDHALMMALPFHIALAPEWTVSYASDWQSVELAVAANGNEQGSFRIGVLHVPRSNETISVREALERSARAAVDLAAKVGLTCQRNQPGAGDARQLGELLATTDVLKILCHGQVWKDDREVALLVDNDGRPPPGYSLSGLVASSSGHRFGRRELKKQRVAPRTVFLGACSSGVVSIGGLDERTSFASLLAGAGTSAVVAPRWKIDAEIALPILDDTMARFLGGATISNAIADASAMAIGDGVPIWQARAFTIEGAWE
ncbi:CHAT domain-containing protein [Rhizobium sp. PP-WC-2G-219]|nr:CHAT domain-containing protein [Rhizobium sp. PP-WC-2G-219]